MLQLHGGPTARRAACLCGPALPHRKWLWPGATQLLGVSGGPTAISGLIQRPPPRPPSWARPPPFSAAATPGPEVFRPPGGVGWGGVGGGAPRVPTQTLPLPVQAPGIIAQDTLAPPGCPQQLPPTPWQPDGPPEPSQLFLLWTLWPRALCLVSHPQVGVGVGLCTRHLSLLGESGHWAGGRGRAGKLWSGGTAMHLLPPPTPQGL